MKNYILKRILISILVLFFVSIIIFGLMHLQPGNPYSHLMDPNTSPETYEKMLTRLGYYDPLPTKYFKWITQFLQGNMGYSIVTGGKVVDLINNYLGNTLLLTISSLVISLAMGIVLGIWTAFNKYSSLDNIITVLSITILSIPTFFIGLVLIKFFAYDLKWFPPSGIIDIKAQHSGIDRMLDIGKHLFLPSFTLALTQVTFFQRYIRSMMIEIIEAEYIKAAMARGMTLNEAVMRHGLINALIPFTTLLFLQIPTLFSGALITETVFVWPGIGRLSYDSIQRRDYLVIIAILMISAVIILISNLIADILYGVIDKRIEWR